MATAKKPAKRKSTTKRKTATKRKTTTRKRSLSGTPKAKKPKKAAKKATTPKAKKPRAAPSPKQKALRKSFAAATELAVDAIYDAGARGSAKPTWGKALRAAYGNGVLSGTPKRRRTKK